MRFMSGTTMRRIRHAASREVQSGNVAPVASRKLVVSLLLRLFLRTSREAGLLRLAAAAIAFTSSWLLVTTCGYVISVLVTVGALVVLATSWRAVLPRRAWEDPLMVGLNRLPTHSRIHNYPTFEAAAARGQSPNVVSLSGVWKFFLASGVMNTPAGFETPEFSDNSWSDIVVPGHWQLQSAGVLDPPIYTNTNYPFPNHPPYAPRKNPTGLYRRVFFVPPDWFAPGVESQPNACLKGRVVLVFQGVDSAFHVWLNGIMVGFAKGSRLPCEFDVTDALRGVGIQSLCLRVVRWSDGSYLEDQDHWWLSGVYREVELVLRPAPARISDFIARPILGGDDYSQGSLEVEVLVECSRTSSATPRQQQLQQVTAAGPATITSIDSEVSDSQRYRESTLIYHDEMETGGVVEQGWPKEKALEDDGIEEVFCTLVDTVTGERFPLDAVGSPADWQLGLPPADARREQREQRRGVVGCVAEDVNSRLFFDIRRDYDADVHCIGRGAGISQTPAVTAKSIRLYRLDRVPGSVRAWSAEDPQLYTLVVELRVRNAREGQKGGRPGVSVFSQFESAKIGFRRILVRSGQLLVNGRAVMLAGVNRHEHDPETGKTVSEESMIKDIVTMKRFNFNAVRNCHYPNHWRWYELCDEMGLYVCDEANIESHGQIPLCRLSADPAWRISYLDRVWRMLAANKNHACIIMWSLGNESGDGSNLVACRRLIKEIDPSRPVVYEGGGRSLAEGCGCTDLTDIVFPMYTGVEATERLGIDGPDGVGETRPCVLCEYSHAMGNSNGNLHKYWEIFRKYRRLQGGFIWDWVDQGLTKYDPVTGRRYWADGGGFSGRHSEGYNLFCVNGVTFPDRTPHPALWEAKFLAQPVGIELLDCSSSTTAPGNFSFARNFFAGGSFPASLLSTTLKNDEKAGSGGWRGNKKGLPAAVDDISLTMADAAARGVTGTSLSVRVTNRYDFLWLDHLSAVWKLQSSSECSESSFLPASGSFSLEGIAPGDCHDVELSVGEDGRSKADSGTGEMAPWGVGEIFLQVEVRLRSDTPWAQAGHLVAWGSFPVASAVARPATATGDMLSCESSCVAAHEASAMGDVTQVPVGGDVLGGMAAVQRPLTSSALIVYDDEDGESVSSPEGSPMGQLQEHLLTDARPAAPAARVIVIRGLLQNQGAGHTRGDGHALNREWMLVVSRVDGSIQRFMAGGVELIEPGEGPSLCLWRAATDNDRAGWPTLMNFVADHRLVSFLARFLPLSRLSHLDRWRASGLSASDPPIFETKGVKLERSSSDECIIGVVTTCSPRRRKGKVLFHITSEIRVTAGGRVEITTSITPTLGMLAACVSLARVGVMLKLPSGFDNVEWFGRGPFECYQDRKHGAVTGYFSGKVDEQHVPYMNPSENGGKADVRWMALRRGDQGAGILFQADGGCPFEAACCGLYSSAELQDAPRTVDLPLRNAADNPVFVHLDHRSMGIGGDNSWYPNVVHKEFTVPTNRSYRFRLRMEALVPSVAAPLAVRGSSPPRSSSS